MKRNNRRALWALGLALPLLAVSGAAPAAAASDDDVVWMRVEVDKDGSEHGLVKINLPISLVEVVVDSIDKKDFLAEIEAEHSIDIAKMWRDIRRMETDEFLTVESDDDYVKVWKDRDYFRVNVREDGSSEPTVQIKVPLDVMDYVFESKRNWSFQDLVERVRPHLPLTLLEVNKQDERVKIWLETR